MYLPALLSQILVAFTIEFDNEFEHRMPHRTTDHGGTAGPWLVSLAMYSNCMQFVGEDGVHAGELEKLARTKTNLNGMKRWGYIVVGPDGIIRATPNGKMARDIWRPLFDEIEKRWQKRFGNDAIARLRESLRALTGRIDIELPDCLPILGHGLFSKVEERAREDRREGLPLPTLLSRVLLAFAVEFERESELSLAIALNLLRVLDEKGISVRELALLTGVSKESLSMAMGVLEKKHIAVVESRNRTKIARLTRKGREIQEASRALIGAIERRWQSRFGTDDLRESLERIVGDPALRSGLEPYPDNWRASVRRPETLPHYPLVLHRGGFPDGS
jgi:DNA-binding MarR family transcriptional regulator